MEEIVLNEESKKVMLDDAIEAYPHECCGFLYGTENGNRQITEAVVVNNTREENRERRFEISPLDYMKAEEYADANDLKLLGIYHSHPDHPAVPSEYDRIHAMPYFSYIIVSVRKRKVAAVNSWRLNDEGQFDEEKVTYKQEPFNVDSLLDALK